MEHYIDRSNGEVLAYDDGTRDEDKRPGIDPLSDQELAEIRAAQAAANAPTPYEAWKVERAKAVAAITVTTSSGRTFDGDETSQNRMARAILGLQSQPEGTTVQWVLHDNSAVLVDLAELQEALTLAGMRQTDLWVLA